MGGRLGEYGDAKRKAQIRKNRLREKDMFKNWARSHGHPAGPLDMPTTRGKQRGLHS